MKTPDVEVVTGPAVVMSGSEVLVTCSIVDVVVLTSAVVGIGVDADDDRLPPEVAHNQLHSISSIEWRPDLVLDGLAIVFA